MELPGPSTVSTCSRPLAEVLKIRTRPLTTMYSPAQESPSENRIADASKDRTPERAAREFNSVSFSAAKSGVFLRICRGDPGAACMVHYGPGKEVLLRRRGLLREAANGPRASDCPLGRGPVQKAHRWPLSEAFDGTVLGHSLRNLGRDDERFGDANIQPGNNRAAVRNQDQSVNVPENPASLGSYVSIYFTGSGPVDNPVATGQAAS